MRKRAHVAYAAGGLVGVALLGSEEAARSQSTPACNSFANGNVVYIAGSSASQPVLQALASTLNAKGLQIGIIYQKPDSCVGVADFLSMAGDGIDAAVYLDPVSGSTTTCDITNGGTGIAPIDLAVSDVFPATCTANTPSIVLTASQKDVLGPIQAMTFAVPSASPASVISAEAAYVVFGFDGAPSVSTWTTPANILVRPATSGTLNMIGSAIGLAAAKWANSEPLPDGGVPASQKKSTGNMQAGVSAGDGPTTIGILSDEAVLQWNGDPTHANATIKVLAYQHTGQTCGYFPDSTSTALDKINVRQGRYALWGPLHFITNVNASGAALGGDMSPTNAQKVASVTTILNYLVATGPTPNATFPVPSSDGGADAGAVTATDKMALIKAEIGDPLVLAKSRAYVVPWCAMQVSRALEVSRGTTSGESSYQPPEPCGCYFESLVGTPEAYCRTCTAGGNECAGTAYPVCRYGYCEAQ